jgi:predicted ATP-grasp superfamily ATP-dependent carboligase
MRGVFKIDLIRDARDGTLLVLEINARYSLWSYLGAVHGVNLPGVAYDVLVRGRTPAPPDYQPRYRWLNLYRDAKACQEAHEDGPLRYVKWAASIASPRNVYEAFAWSDPRPFGAWLVDYLGKKVP